MDALVGLAGLGLLLAALVGLAGLVLLCVDLCCCVAESDCPLVVCLGVIGSSLIGGALGWLCKVNLSVLAVLGAGVSSSSSSLPLK